MIGVTIGVGRGWREAAQSAAEAMGKRTGLRCVVVDDIGTTVPKEKLPKVIHPAWIKAYLLDLFPDENEFLVFDADLIPRRDWDPQAIFRQMRGAFCAVPDRNCETVRDECASFNLPFPDWYVNTGLLMFSRQHAPVWDYVKTKHPKCGSWQEQTALNEALLALSVSVARLPRDFNYLALSKTKSNGEINFHPAGEVISADKLIALQSEFADAPTVEKSPVTMRPEICRWDLANDFPHGGIGAEIGVFEGGFSKELLKRAKPSKLFLVDRFNNIAVSSDKAGKRITVDMEKMPEKLGHKFKGKPIEIVSELGWVWLHNQPKDSLDWVYLDSDHGYFNVRMELLAARKAVKPGGVIAGHDYDQPSFAGVVKAVEDFCREFGLKAEVYAAEDSPSFRIVNVKGEVIPVRAKQPTKLFLALPVYGSLDTSFAQSLIKILADLPCNLMVRFNPGDSLVSRARNSLTAEFLDSDCTHMLFIDTDLIFSGDHVARIMSHPEPIVGGFYPKKQEGPLNWVCNGMTKPTKPQPNGLQEVRYIGTGFLRVAREVFEKMAFAHGSAIHYVPDHAREANQYDFWPVGTYQYPDGSRRYLSEDWYFCQRAMDLGYKVWADLHIVLKHVGQAIYPLKSQQAELLAQGPVKKEKP